VVSAKWQLEERHGILGRARDPKPAVLPHRVVTRIFEHREQVGEIDHERFDLIGWARSGHAGAHDVLALLKALQELEGVRALHHLAEKGRIQRTHDLDCMRTSATLRDRAVLGA
jgi:hypothetical protein